MLNFLKKFIPLSLKHKLSLVFSASKDADLMRYASTERRRVFVFLAGFYQNLGDMAITYSQVTFLQNIFPEAEIIPIASTRTYKAVRTIKSFIKPVDLITILGGGNMDDMYLSLEEARLHIVKNFPDNRIVCFPQTMAFSETPFGAKRREISHKVYAAHKNLTLFVREANSLERVKKYWSDLDIGYCPDIVLSLDKIDPQVERTETLCCFRNDGETNWGKNSPLQIIEALRSQFPAIQVTDTVDVPLEQCMQETYVKTLHDFWNRIRKCKFVVTDRLHCMIFCVITGTPCVVMDNSNHKISGLYNSWIHDIPYIKYLENDFSMEELMDILNDFSEAGFQKEDLSGIQAHFSSLKEKCLSHS